MKVVCAWCQDKDAEATPVEECPPLDDAQTSYGICASHRLEFMIQRYLRALELPRR